MSHIRVAVVGATGKTGSSIVGGLLEAGNFSIVALTRPSSMSKPANVTLKERGVEIQALDLSGPEESLIAALKGVDVLISVVSADEQYSQIPLATAAKKAGVGRFLPCAFITVAPPKGVMALRDWKEDVYNHIKKISLPYTIVDVGWWYRLYVPRLPSGKTDQFVTPISILCGDGNAPTAITHLQDIGRYIAKIIVDERTLNKYVLAYNEVWTPNQAYEKLEELSGEKLPRDYVTEDQISQQIEAADKTLVANPKDPNVGMIKIGGEYQLSWGIRGDNTPEYAKYLGYLTTKELYPEFPVISFESYLREVLDGKAKAGFELPGSK